MALLLTLWHLRDIFVPSGAQNICKRRVLNQKNSKVGFGEWVLQFWVLYISVSFVGESNSQRPDWAAPGLQLPASFDCHLSLFVFSDPF